MQAVFKTFRQTEWSHLRDYVSGAFFDVLPPGALAGELSRLTRNLMRDRAFAERRERLAAAWRAQEPRVVPGESLAVPSLAERPPLEAERAAAGHAILVAFFRLVLGEQPIVLDLRPQRLGWDEGVLHWAPGRLWTVWDDTFSGAIADLYGGYYRAEPSRYAGALDALGLSPAAEAFEAHFGEGDARAVVFELQQFHATFHDVFVRCREAGASLGPGFVGLGLLLACLYETLEGLGGPFDVRAAFDAADRP